MKTLLAIAGALTMVVLANSACAQAFNGSWPLTVTHSQHANGTYCLTLTDNGGLGWRHSGGASLSGPRVGGTLPYGDFQLIRHTIMVTIDSPGAQSGVDTTLVFTAPAQSGSIGTGVYEDAYGETIDSGVVAFGAKGGC
jgi:hypothetical protein